MHRPVAVRPHVRSYLSTLTVALVSARGLSCWNYWKAILNSLTHAQGSSPIMRAHFTTVRRVTSGR
jgi:hypothetical protein